MPSDESLDRLARIAATALRAPIALVSLGSRDHRRLAGAAGLSPQRRRRVSPCADVACDAGVVSVADLRSERPSATSPLLVELSAVAYAAVAVQASVGTVRGSLSVIDTEPREWTTADLATLEDLAAAASCELDALEGKRALALGEQRIRSLVEDLEAVVWEARADDERHRFVNRQAEELLGYPIEEWLNRPRFWEDHLHPDDRETTVDACRAATERAESYTLEYRMIAADGRVVWVRDLVRVHSCGDGRALLRGVMVDNTAEKEAELALHETTQQYRALVEQAPICTYRQIASGDQLLYLGPQIESLTGYMPEEWSDGLFSDRLHPEDREYVLEEVTRCRSENREFSMEYRFTARDGRTVWLLDKTVPIRNDEGGIAFRQGFLLDVTPAKEVEAALQVRETQLRQTQKLEAIGNLAGGVAHDFNNVLLVIRGYCALLLDQMVGRAETEQVLHIEAAAERGARLVRQLLAYGRRQRLEPVRANLNQLLAETLTFLERLIGEDVELRTNLDPDIPPVCIDPARLEEAVVNLAANARDAMPSGGTLEIATRTVELPRDDDGLCPPGGRYVALSVTDTGMGMDDETAGQIFDPFFTTKPEGQGTGLGLAMVHGFLSQSGGSVDIQTAVGKGTTFTLYFPSSQAHTASTTLHHPPRRRRRATSGSSSSKTRKTCAG